MIKTECVIRRIVLMSLGYRHEEEQRETQFLYGRN